MTENNPDSEKLGTILTFKLSELLISNGSNQRSYPINILICYKRIKHFMFKFKNLSDLVWIKMQTVTLSSMRVKYIRTLIN